jgi:choline-phosphate cytidylyltransferase
MPVYVYLDGVFDLFHASHLKFIERVRKDATQMFKHEEVRIIAGVISDKEVESYKRTPVWNLSQRARMVENCRLVDTVIRNSPLTITKDFLDKHRIEYVYHADDSQQSEFFKVPIELGIMRYVKYDEEMSTTAIIQKIKEQY